jgi:hypothetical protein
MTDARAPSGGFYDQGDLQKVAITLFNGWGYNFYRLENQLRADDQLIRKKAAELLGQANARLALAESDYRRDHLPAPTRDKPYPDPQAVAAAQAIERLVRQVDGLKGRITAMPVPENDRMTQRYRQEAQTLHALAAHDEQLIGQAETFRLAIDGRDGAWLAANAPALQEGLKALDETLRQRGLLLSQRF